MLNKGQSEEKRKKIKRIITQLLDMIITIKVFFWDTFSFLFFSIALCFWSQNEHLILTGRDSDSLACADL